jgi:hypothetical protein
MTRQIVTLLAVLSIGTVPAAAQDFALPGTSAMDFSAMTNRTLTNRIGNLSVKSTARAQRRGQAPAGAAPVAGLSALTAAFAPASSFGGETLAPAAPPALDYRPDPEIRRTVESEFVARIVKTDPRVKDSMRQMMATNDFYALFDQTVRPYGYNSRNVADVVAAYTVLNWAIANNQEPPKDAGHAAVRRKVATILSANPVLADPANRQRVADELILRYVLFTGAFQEARKTGQATTMSNHIRQTFLAQNGEDLRQMRFTPQGFIGG